MWRNYLLALLASGATLSCAWGADIPGEFVGPRVVDRENPSYPIAEAERGREGWVIVNYMIGPDGKIFESTVERSSGYANFEKSALRALEKFRYEPATVDGIPVESVATMKFTFTLEGGTNGARPSFVSDYKKVQQAVRENDADTAAQLLVELAENRTSNLYEDAYLGLITADVRRLQGDAEGMMRGLLRATATIQEAEYLPQDAARVALVNLFIVQAQLNYLAEALKTYEKLRLVPDSEREIEQIQPFVDQVNDFLASGKGLAIDGAVQGDGGWSRWLLLRHFRVEPETGKLSAVKLRCDAAYRMYTLEADAEFTLEPAWGDCHMQILGKPGSTFRLVQY